MIRFLHLADVHLDSPFTLYNIAEGEKRRSELRSAFSSAIMYIKDNRIPLCFIAGDLFDSEYITGDGARFISSCISECRDCMFFLTPGNHDPATEESPYMTMKWPENLKIFTERDSVDLPELNTAVYGVGFTDGVMTSSPVTGWSGVDGSRINILVCHGDTSSSASPNGPVTADGISASPFDYIALGHIHKPSGLQKSGNTYWCYPGCLVGRSYDEPGRHGAVVGEIEKGRVVLSGVSFSDKHYETCECDLTGCGKYDALTKVRSTISEYKNDTLLRLILTGVMTEGVTVSPTDIGRGEGMPYRIEIIDKTSVKPELTSIESDVSIKGIFCRKLQERGGFSDGEDVSDILSLAMKYGLSALEDRGFSVITEDDDE